MVIVLGRAFLSRVLLLFTSLALRVKVSFVLSILSFFSSFFPSSLSTGSGTVYFNLYKSTNCDSATKSNTLFAPLNVCLDSNSYRLFDDDAPASTAAAALSLSSAASGTREQKKSANEQHVEEQELSQLISLLDSVSYTTAVLTCCDDCEIPTPTDDNGVWATR
jgi:hypothetical protein